MIHEPWHGQREVVFAAMRKLGDIVTDWEQRGRKLLPPHGTLAVGGADFDYLLKAIVGEEYLRALRRGHTPAEALELAKVAGTEAVHKWNTTESKSRVSINHRSELQRWNKAGEAAAEHIHALFVGQLPEEVR